MSQSTHAFFSIFRRPLPNCYDYDGYGDLTAVYGRDGKKLRGFAYRNHIMVEHSQPDGLVSRYEYDRYDTDGKVLKSSNNLGEEWTFDYRKDHTVVTDALGQKCTVSTKTGNLDDVNIARESASCNLSAGSSGYVKEGMSCIERGSCGAPYGR